MTFSSEKAPLSSDRHTYLRGVGGQCVVCGHIEPFEGMCADCGENGHRAIHCQRTKETSCVWHSGCAAPIQCAAAGHCLSIPRDLADTQTEVRPSNGESNRDKVLRGEVVKVTDDRLREMQRICVANEGVGYESFHWHWAAVVNELIERRAVETSAPVWKRMRNQVPSNGTWIWWDYGKGPMLQRAQDFASEDDGYWIEATPPLRSPEEPTETLTPRYECHVCGRKYLTVEARDHHQEECTDASEAWRQEKAK